MTTNETNPPPSLIEKAEAWSTLDPNSSTSTSVTSLINRIQSPSHSTPSPIDLATLSQQFSTPISFGTAGLRSKMAAGISNMNDLVVIQTAQGIASYLKSLHTATPNLQLTAVVGYDHRQNPALTLSSKKFAYLTKAAFEHLDIQTTLLSSYVPTPFVPFSINQLNREGKIKGEGESKCCIGVMVTASHNPKEDNGYKVYNGDGVQITGPDDVDIKRFIEMSENRKVWSGVYDGFFNGKVGDNVYDDSVAIGETERLTSLYFDTISSQLKVSNLPTSSSSNENDNDNDNGNAPPKVIYTAMHGVGHPFAQRAFKSFDLPPFQSVAEQCEPDYTFPTTPFPNPEEKGALDGAMKFAEEFGGDLILANDPDADRLACAERNGQTGEWTVFTGDQLGVLLGLWCFENFAKNKIKNKGKAGTDGDADADNDVDERPCAIVGSAVSSRMLKRIGEVEGFEFIETLTGFKWIGRESNLLRTQGYNIIFSYEEAIGYCCGSVISDKDGISAAAVFTQMATHAYCNSTNTNTGGSGSGSVKRMLDGVYAKYGNFVSRNGYFYCHDASSGMKVIEGIRNDGKYMKTVGPFTISSIRDLGSPGYDSSTPSNLPLLATSSSSPFITLTFTNGCVAHFRGSGTEPKFKYYVEMCGEVGVGREMVERELEGMVGILIEEIIKPERNGLSR